MSNLQSTCPFCRHPLPGTMEEGDKNLMKRVVANDPAAVCVVAKRARESGDYGSALKHFRMAAEMGNADAHFTLSFIYRKG